MKTAEAINAIAETITLKPDETFHLQYDNPPKLFDEDPATNDKFVPHVKHPVDPDVEQFKALAPIPPVAKQLPAPTVYPTLQIAHAEPDEQFVQFAEQMVPEQVPVTLLRKNEALQAVQTGAMFD